MQENNNINVNQNDANLGRQMIENANRMMESMLPIDTALQELNNLFFTIYKINDEKKAKLDRFMRDHGYETLHDVISINGQANPRDYAEAKKLLKPRLTPTTFPKAMLIYAKTAPYLQYRRTDDPFENDKNRLEKNYVDDFHKILMSAGFKQEEIDKIVRSPINEIENKSKVLIDKKLAVIEARKYFSSHDVDVFKIENFLTESGYNVTQNDLSEEQYDAVVNKRDGKPYDKEKYSEVQKLLQGPKLTKEVLEKAVKLAKEQYDILAKAEVLNPSSELVQKLKTSLDKLETKLDERGMSKNEFKALVADVDLSKPEELKAKVANQESKNTEKAWLKKTVDFQVDAVYSKIGKVFQCDKYPDGARLDSKNMKELASLIKTLKLYKNAVNNDDSKTLEEKTLVDVTLRKFYQFANVKGLTNQELDRLIESSLENESDHNKEIINNAQQQNVEALNNNPQVVDQNRVQIDLTNEVNERVQEEVEPMNGYQARERNLERQNDQVLNQ